VKICPTIIEILTFDKWSLKFTVSKSVLSYLRSMDLTDVSIGALWSTPQVWLPCSNAAKTRYPLKHDGVPQTSQSFSAVSGPMFTILRRHLEDMLLLNKFFPIVDKCLGCEDIAWQSCAMVPRWRFLTTFFGSCIFSEPRAAHFRPAF